MGFAEIYGQARASASSVVFETGIATGTPALFTQLGVQEALGTDTYIRIVNRNSMENGVYLATPQCGTVTNGAIQGSGACVGNGVNYQSMLGNINGTNGSSHGDWMCNLSTGCGTGPTRKILYFVR